MEKFCFEKAGKFAGRGGTRSCEARFPSPHPVSYTHLLNMVMNDDTWYVVRNTRGVTGFVGPGSKPVPLTEEEMMPLGIQKPDIEVDFAEGDMVVVTGGAWKDTAGVITGINMQKQTVTINVELFGRETPVEISFAEIKKAE